MSDTFQIKNQKGIYFLTFQVVGWADVFTRRDYKDIIIESIEYCRTYKSLKIYSYVIMQITFIAFWQLKIICQKL
jgi:hypothetical protein